MTSEWTSTPAGGAGTTALELRALQDAPFAVVLYEGPEHRLAFSNRQHDELTAGRMVVGRTLVESLPELVGQPPLQALDRVYATGRPESAREVPTELVRHGVRCKAWFDVSWQPVCDAEGCVVAVLATAVDVSEHVKARHALEAARAEAEADLVERRALEVALWQREAHSRGLVEELRRALEVRDEFLVIASHELRTPLTTLQLQLQDASRRLDDAGALPKEKLAHKLEMARRQTERLTRLVDGLLDVSRLSLGQLALEPEAVDVAGLARAVVERHVEPARRARCSIVLEAAAPVVGCLDRARLEQVVTHLVTNAIKYGAGKPIVVRVEADDARARVSVRDEGMGISAEDRERIFERFERAVSSRNYGGLGLGLYVARRIVRAHGGDIEVASEPGRGATFTAWLPLRPDPSAAGKGQGAGSGRG